MERVRFHAILAMVAALAAISTLAVPAHATQTPDEESVLDAITLPHPQLLPDVLDIGAANGAIEGLLPEVIDEWATMSVGGCSLAADLPSVSPDGFRVQGAATISCAETQRATKLVLCLQRRVAGRWEVMKESCRGAVSVGQTSTRKRTSGGCLTGTWRYRVYAAASSVGASPQVHGRPGPVAIIRCRTFGL